MMDTYRAASLETVELIASALQRGQAMFSTGLCVRQPVGWYCPTHTHPVWELIYHARGVGMTTVNARQIVVYAEGSAIIHPPGQSHDQRQRKAGEDHCVLIDIPAPLPAIDDCWYIPNITDPLLRAEISALAGQSPAENAFSRQAQHARASAIFFDLLQALIHAPRQPSPMDHGVEEAARYLQREYHRQLHMSEVAQHVGLSESYLRHRFRARYGESMLQRLTAIRIDRARDLLLNTPYPLKSIARVCGFDNERYFSKIFRKVAGCTPGSFRTRSYELSEQAQSATPQ